MPVVAPLNPFVEFSAPDGSRARLYYRRPSKALEIDIDAYVAIFGPRDDDELQGSDAWRARYERDRMVEDRLVAMRDHIVPQLCGWSGMVDEAGEEIEFDPVRAENLLVHDVGLTYSLARAFARPDWDRRRTADPNA